MLIATCRVTRVHTSEVHRVTITLVYAMPCNHGDNIDLKKDIIAELHPLERSQSNHNHILGVVHSKTDHIHRQEEAGGNAGEF